MGFALAFVLAVKAAFMNAPAEAFRWLLAPTVALTELLSGHPFSWEQGVGYVNNGLHYSIAAACSGLTFFVAASGALMSVLATGKWTVRDRLVRCAGALGLAWFTTVLANTVRLVSALAMLEHHVGLPGLDAENSHRLLGVVVYLVALVLVVQVARGPRALGSPLLVAVAWYAGVTLVLPMLRGMPTDRQFVVHALSVVAACGLLGLLRWTVLRRRAIL